MPWGCQLAEQRPAARSAPAALSSSYRETKHASRWPSRNRRRMPEIDCVGPAAGTHLRRPSVTVSPGKASNRDIPGYGRCWTLEDGTAGTATLRRLGGGGLFWKHSLGLLYARCSCRRRTNIWTHWRANACWCGPHAGPLACARFSRGVPCLARLRLASYTCAGEREDTLESSWEAGWKVRIGCRAVPSPSRSGEGGISASAITSQPWRKPPLHTSPNSVGPMPPSRLRRPPRALRGSRVSPRVRRLVNCRLLLPAGSAPANPASPVQSRRPSMSACSSVMVLWTVVLGGTTVN